jgi:hypothetical protein
VFNLPKRFLQVMLLSLFSHHSSDYLFFYLLPNCCFRVPKRSRLQILSVLCSKIHQAISCSAKADKIAKDIGTKVVVVWNHLLRSWTRHVDAHFGTSVEDGSMKRHEENASWRPRNPRVPIAHQLDGCERGEQIMRFFSSCSVLSKVVTHKLAN